VLVAVAVALAAGCGGSGNGRAREWIANARGVVQQLRADVGDAETLDRLGPARRAMHDDSQVYGLLVTYSDLGGCAHEVAALGSPPPRYVAARRELLRACRPLARAVRLFTHAMTRGEPRALVAAARAAVAAVGPLDRAALALAKQ
jgi:hypothetical protein